MPGEVHAACWPRFSVARSSGWREPSSRWWCTSPGGFPPSPSSVRADIKDCGLAFPGTRLTVNLAPADLRKQGPAYDLPGALGILLANDQPGPTSPPASSLASPPSTALCATQTASSPWSAWPRTRASTAVEIRLDSSHSAGRLTRVSRLLYEQSWTVPIS